MVQTFRCAVCLGNNAKRRGLAALAGCAAGLRNLDLDGGNRLTGVPEVLAACLRLETLNLSGCGQLGDVSAFVSAGVRVVQ